MKSTSSIGESSLETDARVASAHAAIGGSAAIASAASQTQTAPTPLDKSSLEALIAREYLGLRLLIARRAGDPHVAADLLNDAVCITWEKWQAGHIERPECIAGYIFQVAMNLLRNHRRSVVERPERRAGKQVLQTLENDASDNRQIEESLAAQLKEVLRSMSTERDRAVLVRFYLEEEDKESICQDLHLTRPQFARVLHRARERMRKLLESGGMKKADLFSVLLVL